LAYHEGMKPRTKYALQSTGFATLFVVSALALLYGGIWLLVWSPIWMVVIILVAVILGLFYWSGLKDYDRNHRR